MKASILILTGILCLGVVILTVGTVHADRIRITASQEVFKNVIATTQPCPPGSTGTCSLVTGEIASQQFCGTGTVSFFVVDSAQTPPTAKEIGQLIVDVNCDFSGMVSNVLNGQGGSSYGLMTVQAAGASPAWTTCTGGPCPD